MQDIPLGTMIAIDPSNGLYLRQATSEEFAGYLSAQDQRAVGHASWRRPVRVGAILVDEWTGYGADHIPGRFARRG